MLIENNIAKLSYNLTHIKISRVNTAILFTSIIIQIRKFDILFQIHGFQYDYEMSHQLHHHVLQFKLLFKFKVNSVFQNYTMALFRDSDILKKIGKSEIYNGIIKNFNT